jgi:molecular chaperone HscB
MKKGAAAAAKVSMSENAFTRFGLQQSFVVDLAVLESAYFRAQQASHPDQLIGRSDAERLQALQVSMDVNADYEMLKSPLSRAQYLLEQRGMIVNRDGKGIKPSQSLLMESLESREALENAKTIEELQQLAQNTQCDIHNCIEQIAHAFEENTLEVAAQAVTRLRYLEKLQQEIARKQRSI